MISKNELYNETDRLKAGFQFEAAMEKLKELR